MPSRSWGRSFAASRISSSARYPPHGGHHKPRICSDCIFTGTAVEVGIVEDEPAMVRLYKNLVCSAAACGPGLAGFSRVAGGYGGDPNGRPPLTRAPIIKYDAVSCTAASAAPARAGLLKRVRGSEITTCFGKTASTSHRTRRCNPPSAGKAREFSNGRVWPTTRKHRSSRAQPCIPPQKKIRALTDTCGSN